MRKTLTVLLVIFTLFSIGYAGDEILPEYNHPTGWYKYTGWGAAILALLYSCKEILKLWKD